MISSVASPSTEATGVASPAAGETADTGVFDALMALQSLINADAATGVNTQLAGALEGAELLADTVEDSAEDSPVDDEPVEDSLWFLAAPLPAPALKVSDIAVATGASAAAQIHPDAANVGAGAAPAAASQAGLAGDLAQAFSFGAIDANAGDPQSSIPDSQAPVTPVIDTTTWNSLTTPAELFAHASRTGAAERAESATLATHVRDPRWADDLGNRLASMVRTGESSASLQMTPPDLGPLEVKVSVRENQATVHFGAANAETRALLEASMPRLREMLASQGFQLMDSSVSHGFARQTRHETAGTPRIDGIGESPTPIAHAVHITGLLDVFA